MLAARPAEVVDMMNTVDYGTLDGYGESVLRCAETLALAEVGRTSDAIATAESCYHVLDSSRQGNFLLHALVEFHSFALMLSGRVREALELTQRRHHDAATSPSTARSMAGAIAGMVALASGDLRTALRLLPAESPAEDEDMVLANSFYRFHLLRAQALARTGDVTAATAAMRVAQADRHPTYVLVEVNALLAEAWLAAAQQQISAAREFARRAADFARDHGQLAREVHCLQTAAQFDDTTVAERLEALAAVVEGPRAAAAAAYARALSLDDADRLAAASAEFEAMGDQLAAADSSAQASTAYRRAGRGGSAMTAAARATALAAACGASSPALDAARLHLPLTRREHEIAVLVAQGMTNREIAQAVSLSVRTIEGHIYRATCKAGVARRSELASVIRGLAAPVVAGAAR